MCGPGARAGPGARFGGGAESRGAPVGPPVWEVRGDRPSNQRSPAGEGCGCGGPGRRAVAGQAPLKWRRRLPGEAGESSPGELCGRRWAPGRRALRAASAGSPCARRVCIPALDPTCRAAHRELLVAGERASEGGRLFLLACHPALCVHFYTSGKSNPFSPASDQKPRLGFLAFGGNGKEHHHHHHHHSCPAKVVTRKWLVLLSQKVLPRQPGPVDVCVETCVWQLGEDREGGSARCLPLHGGGPAVVFTVLSRGAFV